MIYEYVSDNLYTCALACAFGNHHLAICQLVIVLNLNLILSICIVLHVLICLLCLLNYFCILCYILTFIYTDVVFDLLAF